MCQPRHSETSLANIVESINHHDIVNRLRLAAYCACRISTYDYIQNMPCTRSTKFCSDCGLITQNTSDDTMRSVARVLLERYAEMQFRRNVEKHMRMGLLHNMYDLLNYTYDSLITYIIQF